MKAVEARPAAKQASKSLNPFFSKGGNALLSNEIENGHGSFFSPQKNFFFKPTSGTIQTKLTIGKPKDKYEQEADVMADKVVQRLSENKVQTKPEKNNSLPGNKGGTIQRQPVAPISSITPLVQTKCDRCEQEEKLQKKEKEGDKDLLKDKLQKKPIFESNTERPEDENNIQRKCAACENENEKKLQRKPEKNSSQFLSGRLWSVCLLGSTLCRSQT